MTPTMPTPRRIRKSVALKLALLLFFTPLVLCLSGNALYSFRSAQPLETTVEVVLAGQVHSGAYIRLTAQPDYRRAFTYVRYGAWATTFFPLLGADDRLIVRADQWELPADVQAPGAAIPIDGRLGAWDDVPFSRQVGDLFAETYGLTLGDDVYALNAADDPATYRATRTLWAGLALAWLAVAASLVWEVRTKRA
ncbi:MAG: hypothetical protein GX605_13175 [Chloroflexi bacterium]|nr:hypothetical protein [Chloroflexota bacterium]